MDYIEDLKYTRLLQQTLHALLHGVDVACMKGVGIALSQLFESHEHNCSLQGTAVFAVQLCVFCSNSTW